MSEQTKKPPIEVQTRAVLIHAPGVGYLVKTDNGQTIAISQGLAVDIANQILATETGGALIVPPQRSALLQ